MIPAPKILSMDIALSLLWNWGQILTVKVTASDPNSYKLTFRPVGAGFAVTIDNGIQRIYLDEAPVYLSTDPNKFMLRIWIWNEQYLVSLTEKEFSFLN